MNNSDSQVQEIVDNLFRMEYGKIVGFLTKKFGSEYFELAEDAVQEAMYAAMKTWPMRSIPDNPSGWIFRAANNKMIDKLRKLSKIEFGDVSHRDLSDDGNKESDDFDSGLKDEQLMMLFACCDPKLSIEYQIILSLKILCGLSVKEISACLLKKESTVAKSYTRAKKRFIEQKINIEIPDESQLNPRLAVVLKVVYLLFNEGYKTSDGDQLYNLDLCAEAIRLGQLLLENKLSATNQAHALIALMFLHMARSESRIGTEGDLITLEHQDRSLWNKEMIGIGNYHLNISIQDMEYSEYHIQAAIASLHCNAAEYTQTNWAEILSLYDALLKIKPSPVCKLNRLVPLSKVKGSATALEEINEIGSSGFFDNYYLFHVIKGQLYKDLNNSAAAQESYTLALKLTNNSREKSFIKKQLASWY